jgi:hypothetical protein
VAAIGSYQLAPIITKGGLRLVAKEPGRGTPEYGYCMTCAREMAEQAENALTVLRAELG